MVQQNIIKTSPISIVNTLKYASNTVVNSQNLNAFRATVAQQLLNEFPNFQHVLNFKKININDISEYPEIIDLFSNIRDKVRIEETKLRLFKYCGYVLFNQTAKYLVQVSSKKITPGDIEIDQSDKNEFADFYIREYFERRHLKLSSRKKLGSIYMSSGYKTLLKIITDHISTSVALANKPKMDTTLKTIEPLGKHSLFADDDENSNHTLVGDLVPDEDTSVQTQDVANADETSNQALVCDLVPDDETSEQTQDDSNADETSKQTPVGDIVPDDVTEPTKAQDDAFDPFANVDENSMQTQTHVGGFETVELIKTQDDEFSNADGKEYREVPDEQESGHPSVIVHTSTGKPLVEAVTNDDSEDDENEGGDPDEESEEEVRERSADTGDVVFSDDSDDETTENVVQPTKRVREDDDAEPDVKQQKTADRLTDVETRL